MSSTDSQADAGALIYAKALFSLAEKSGGKEAIDQTNSEIEAILEIARADKMFNEFLSSRVFPAKRRAASLTYRGADNLATKVIWRNNYRRLKYAVNAAAISGGSSTPHTSRIECIESCGTPTSIVSMPNRVAVIGPIVVPHVMLLRETNVWVDIFAAAHAVANGAIEVAPVA